MSLLTSSAWSRPRPEERLTKISTFVAKGQKTNIWFALFALEPLKSFSVSVQPEGTHKEQPQATKSASRVLHPSSPSVQIRYVHFWAQRTDWRGRTYYITPELLLPMRDSKALFPAKGGTLEGCSPEKPKKIDAKNRTVRQETHPPKTKHCRHLQEATLTSLRNLNKCVPRPDKNLAHLEVRPPAISANRQVGNSGRS